MRKENYYKFPSELEAAIRNYCHVNGLLIIKAENFGGWMLLKVLSSLEEFSRMVEYGNSLKSQSSTHIIAPGDEEFARQHGSLSHIAMCLPENQDLFISIAEGHKLYFTPIENTVPDSKMLVFSLQCSTIQYVEFIEHLTAVVRERNLSGPAIKGVLRPEYYNQDNPYEVIKVIRAWGLDFELGNAAKYIARAGKKNPETEIEDLEKAKTYIEMKTSYLKAQRDARKDI